MKCKQGAGVPSDYLRKSNSAAWKPHRN